MLGRGSSRSSGSPRSSGSSRLELEAGQASVELVAVLPLVMLAGLVAWQLLLAGHSLWLRQRRSEN
jgi:hypothetical protein